MRLTNADGGNHVTRRAALLTAAGAVAALTAASPIADTATVDAAAPGRPEASQMSSDAAPSSTLLSLLPDGETKRKFILDCTGCHQFDRRTIASGDWTKTREEWVARINQMIAFAGANSAFPVMSAERQAEPTADWLVEHLGSGAAIPEPEPQPEPRGDIVIREYDVPVPVDLPHDVMVAPDGKIVVTGMLTHQMYVLDPESGEFETISIPVPNANPRALDIDDAGNWLVLLGAPQRMARFDPATQEWESWELGMYPHSVIRDGAGRIWFNGHFTADPELIGHLDTTSGQVVTYEVPGEAPAAGGSTIPYGLRVAPNGTIWGTQLAGNRLVRFDPAIRAFRLYPLPTSHSGPRRLDVGPDGTVWIPEYAGNKLARFDPVAERFHEYEFPIPDALPYVVRVDRRREMVWIGTAAADVIARFDPAAERFDIYPLPTRGALVRHIDIDEATGTVWGAYSPAPAIRPRVFSVRAPR